MTCTVLIMAGGTGGHIFPGLAVAEALRSAGCDVVWLGARGGMEERLVPPQGIRAVWIRARALRGRRLLDQLLFPAGLLLAFWQSARAIFALRPDVVLGLGGYVAFPGGMMASLLGRPLAVHEQNAVPGLANRVLSALADRVMVAFPGALNKAEWTGNPVRGAIVAVPVPELRFAGRHGPLRILVVGGSLGAQVLNEMLPRALALLPPERRPAVVHQSGEQNLEPLRAAYASVGVTGELVAFIDDMAGHYAAADVVICRAGALTVSELAAAGVAAVLVPYPYAVDDHQTANARFLVAQDAAVLLAQDALTPQRLAALIDGLDRTRLLAMAKRARALGKPDAAATVAAHCMALAA